MVTSVLYQTNICLIPDQHLSYTRPTSFLYQTNIFLIPDQHTQMIFFNSAISLKQLFIRRHVPTLRNIIITPNKPDFALTS